MTQGTDRPAAVRGETRAWDRAALLVLLVLSTALFVRSESVRYGDGPIYTLDILHGSLIEPGHLVWRPLGSLSSHLLGMMQSSSQTLWVLQFLCVATSVLAVLAIYLLLRALFRPTPAFLGALLFLLSNGFWVYSFTGSSYGLSVLLCALSLRLAIKPPEALRRLPQALLVGVACGLATASWAIQVIVAPSLWLVLLLGPADNRRSLRSAGTMTAALAAGFLAAFVVPLLIGYTLSTTNAPECGDVVGAMRPSFAVWLSCTQHHIPAHFGLASVLRMLMGWPQSIVSIGDLNYQLRLWLFHESAFPLTPWLAVLAVWYAALAAALLVLARHFRSLDRPRQGVLLAALLALVVNLLFAIAWQGTDLERYLPSLPFQLLIFAQVIELQRAHWGSATVLAGGMLVLLIVGLVNWTGTFAPVLARDSYRQAWVDALHQATGPNDLVVLFGPRARVIALPHDPTLPKIDNVSNEIVQRAESWRARELHDIDVTLARGGRVFLSDSLFASGYAPRDGWSFKEYPNPTPREIAAVFQPLRSDRIAFVVHGERVWAAVARH
jgi:hypothetical protein